MFLIKVIRHIKKRYHSVKSELLDKLYAHQNNYYLKTLLIIKLDAIGDYALFRTFLKNIHHSSKYKDYQITLLGNQLWKDIAIHFDSDYVNNFIWINPTDLNQSKFRRELEKKIYHLKFEEVIYPTYSRIDFGDSIVIRSGANKKISFKGDARNFSNEGKKIKNDLKYDVLIEVENTLSFEFYRYIDFFSHILNVDLKGEKPLFFNKTTYSKKIILCPGSSSISRRWSIKNFHKLTEKILEKTGNDYTVFICGSSSDSSLAADFNACLPLIKIVDLTGKYSLVDFIDFISDAFLIITNDSGPLHLAVACNVNVLGLSNGNNFARFVPYPKEINEKLITIFPEALNNLSTNFEKIKQLQDNDSTYNINDITVEQVMNELKLNTIL